MAGINPISISSEVAASRLSGATQSDKYGAAAKEFESIFLSTMLQQAFPEPSEDNPFSGGQAEETWRGFMIDEYAKAIVDKGGLGLSDKIRSELLALQEIQQ